MHLPDQEPSAHDNENAELVEFNQLKKDELKEIEEFIQILNDWIHEKQPDLDALESADKDMSEE